MVKTVNKGCLQKPKRQTAGRNPIYFPHLIIRAAKRNQADPDSYYESAAKLRQYMAKEEQAINDKIKLIVA